jgi:isopentenyl phosphate kinase
MIMDLIILKIGGSSITLKDEDKLKARDDVIRRVAGEIKRAKQERDFKIIVVHGAGPFGHKVVADYGIRDGLNTEKGIEGFVRTHNSMEDLNKVFMDIFREEGLLGFPVQPSACIVQDSKRIVKLDTGIIKALLDTNKDIIPIMYGDMVLDRSLRASVVSGDAIVSYLSGALKPSRILMGSDVDGIFREDPKINPRAELVKTISSENFEKVLEGVGEANTTDVTGGMRGKIMELRNGLRGVNAVVFNITKEGNAYNLLKGGRGIGTEILF